MADQGHDTRENGQWQRPGLPSRLTRRSTYGRIPTRSRSPTPEPPRPSEEKRRSSYFNITMADSVRDSRSSASGHAQRPGLPSRLTRRSTFYGGVPSAPSIEITPTTDGISESDLTSLRRTRDSIPLTVWLAALLGMFERFAYYGASAPFQNYMQNSIDDPSRPGVLGLGQAKATTVIYQTM
jgi:hypothetical protein